jgi:hypothetical protein
MSYLENHAAVDDASDRRQISTFPERFAQPNFVGDIASHSTHPAALLVEAGRNILLTRGA